MLCSQNQLKKWCTSPLSLYLYTFFQGLCSWTKNKLSSLASQKTTSSNHAPKKRRSSRIPSTQRVVQPHALSILLEHLSRDKCAKSGDFRRKSGETMAFEVSQCSPPAAKLQFPRCFSHLRRRRWGFFTPTTFPFSCLLGLQFDQINLEQWPISQSPWLSTSPPSAVLNLIKVEHDGYTGDSIQKKARTNRQLWRKLKVLFCIRLPQGLIWTCFENLGMRRSSCNSVLSVRKSPWKLKSLENSDFGVVDQVKKETKDPPVLKKGRHATSP